MELENRDLKQKLAKALEVIAKVNAEGQSQGDSKSSYESDFILRKYKEVKQQLDEAARENEALRAQLGAGANQETGA